MVSTIIINFSLKTHIFILLRSQERVQQIIIHGAKIMTHTLMFRLGTLNSKQNVCKRKSRLFVGSFSIVLINCLIFCCANERSKYSCASGSFSMLITFLKLGEFAITLVIYFNRRRLEKVIPAISNYKLRATDG